MSDNKNSIQTVEDFKRFFSKESGFNDREFVKQEFTKLAQKIVNELCDSNNVPRITVEFKDKMPVSSAGSFFQFAGYKILINFITTAPMIIHEFNHYVIHLFSIMDELEENTVERATEGYMKELRSEKSRIEGDLLFFDQLGTELQNIERVKEMPEN